MEQFTFEVEHLSRGVLITGSIYDTRIRIAAASLPEAYGSLLQEAEEWWHAGNSDRQHVHLRMSGITLAPEREV